jgi:hypothetical protein
VPDGGSLPVCNGAQGVAGPQGPQGATGAIGATGPGANAKCATEFAGSHFCTMADFDEANGTVSPGRWRA